MTWHETIEYIRQDPAFAELVEKAYFDENLQLNVTRFGESEEFVETIKLIKQYHPDATNILEIGAGNGIAAINFGLLGYNVTVVEPDPSDTVGAGAIRKLVEIYNLSDKIQVYETYAEDINFETNIFDIVYVRQAMHHAADLDKFISEAARVLKPKGYLFTIRDHVIYDDEDMQWFLEMHPLHKFYGGENAFQASQYKEAIEKSGLKIVKELKHYDSVINYFPMTSSQFKEQSDAAETKLKSQLDKRLPFITNLPFLFQIYKISKGIRSNAELHNEKLLPGRMYSYIAQK